MCGTVLFCTYVCMYSSINPIKTKQKKYSTHSALPSIPQHTGPRSPFVRTTPPNRAVTQSSQDGERWTTIGEGDGKRGAVQELSFSSIHQFPFRPLINHR